SRSSPLSFSSDSSRDHNLPYIGHQTVDNHATEIEARGDHAGLQDVLVISLAHLFVYEVDHPYTPCIVQAYPHHPVDRNAEGDVESRTRGVWPEAFEHPVVAV